MSGEGLDRARIARQQSLSRIDQQFNVTESVRTLQEMMRTITKQELSAASVNAACNCVSQINNTMKTVIMAARFLADH